MGLWSYLETCSAQQNVISSCFSKVHESIYIINDKLRLLDLSGRVLCEVTPFSEESPIDFVSTRSGLALTLDYNSLSVYSSGLAPLVKQNLFTSDPSSLGNAQVLRADEEVVVAFEAGLSVYDVNSFHTPLYSLHHTDLTDVSIDGKQLFCGFTDGTAVLYDTLSGVEAQRIFSKPIQHISYCQSSKRFAVASPFNFRQRNPNVFLYDLRVPTKPLQSYTLANVIGLNLVENRVLFVFRNDSSFYHVDINRERVVGPYSYHSELTQTLSYTVSSTGNVTSLVNVFGQCRVWATGTGFIRVNTSGNTFGTDLFTHHVSAEAEAETEPPHPTRALLHVYKSERNTATLNCNEPTISSDKSLHNSKNFDPCNEWPREKFNKTLFTGLENDDPLASINSLVPLVYFNDKLRTCVDHHYCPEPVCVVCELAYLFEAMDEQSLMFSHSKFSSFTKLTGGIVSPKSFLRAVYAKYLSSGISMTIIDVLKSIVTEIEDCKSFDFISLTGHVRSSSSDVFSWLIPLITTKLEGNPDSIYFDCSDVVFNNIKRRVLIPPFLTNKGEQGYAAGEVPSSSNCYELEAVLFLTEKGNIIGSFTIPSRFPKCNGQWLEFNGFTLQLTKPKVLSATPELLPLILHYRKPQSSSLQQCSVMKYAACYNDIQQRFSSPLLYSLNLKTADHVAINVENFLSSSFQCVIGMDTEFVELYSDVATQRFAVGRVSVVLAGTHSDKGINQLPEAQIIIDDHVIIDESVKDYVTLYSGLTSHDLNPELSTKYLTFMKHTFLKVKYLVDSNCIVVGHGIRKDFHLLSIYVPNNQIVDTVELFRLPQHRLLSLKLLAFCLLGLKIQQHQHDSVTDSLIAFGFERKTGPGYFDSLYNWTNLSMGKTTY
ncbi:hypothetical protein RCL1_000853 [Eukaryota sp. TZLM3-RCL]